ncbi:MAG TPA: NfeD family protein [Clostridia bacterium]
MNLTALFASTFWEQFVELFAGMGVAAGICLVLGLILCIIEIFQPGFGIFGALGTILIIAGLVIRMLQGGTLLMLFIMIFIIIIILMTAFMIMVRSMKYGWLSRTELIQSGTAVNPVRSDATDDYSYLLSKTGKTTTPLRPSGKAVIDDKEYDVVAQGAFIEKGVEIKVVEVEGVRIVVRAKEEN